MWYCFPRAPGCEVTGSSSRMIWRFPRVCRYFETIPIHTGTIADFTNASFPWCNGSEKNHIICRFTKFIIEENLCFRVEECSLFKNIFWYILPKNVGMVKFVKISRDSSKGSTCPNLISNVPGYKFMQILKRERIHLPLSCPSSILWTLIAQYIWFYNTDRRPTDNEHNRKWA